MDADLPPPDDPVVLTIRVVHLCVHRHACPLDTGVFFCDFDSTPAPRKVCSLCVAGHLKRSKR